MTDEHNAQVEPNVRVTDEMVEAAARNILRAAGRKWVDMESEWKADVARYRDMCARFPDYEKGGNEVIDAFRSARAALSSAPVPPVDGKVEPVEKMRAERDEAIRRGEDQWAGWIKSDCRVRELETALKNLRQTILEDDTAITDTLWMPGSIIMGCTAVDYIDLTLASPPARHSDEEVERLRAENDRLRGYLERIACFSQDDNLLWWQVQARAALQRDAQGGGE